MVDWEQTGEGSSLRQLKLLYVEDDEAVRESLLRFLQRRFDTVYAAKDGREGLQLYRDHRPDMIVTDIQMPVMDGLEMARQIREIQPDVPVLITTAFNEVSYLMRAIELGITHYIKKPIVKEDFIRSLQECAKILLQQRELDAKNQIIRTIMDWQPCFTILSTRDHLEYMNRSLLNYLGYETMRHFLDSHGHLDGFIQHENDSGEGRPWYERIISRPDTDHVVFLKNAKEKEARRYVVRFHYFERSNTYIFAFLDPAVESDPSRVC